MTTEKTATAEAQTTVAPAPPQQTKSQPLLIVICILSALTFINTVVLIVSLFVLLLSHSHYGYPVYDYPSYVEPAVPLSAEAPSDDGSSSSEETSSDPGSAAPASSTSSTFTTTSEAPIE